jgi:hypothetical protein
LSRRSADLTGQRTKPRLLTSSSVR